MHLLSDLMTERQQHSLLDLINEQAYDDEDEAPTIFQHSPYYDEEGIKQISLSNPNSFKILSLNCQSLQAKFDQIKLYIENSLSNVHAICLQETWLNCDSDTSLLQLNGYNLISKGKSASAHGGVAIYLKDTFKYSILTINSLSNIWDGIFIEIIIDESYSTQFKKTLILGNIYRPPRDNMENYENFINEIEQILHRFQSCNKDIAITGDFNIDLLKIKDRPIFNNFFETILSNGFIPKITFPTRITSQSSTLIDNILVKISRSFSYTTAGILLSNISDHLPCFISLDYLEVKENSVKYVKTWLRSEKSYSRFKNEISDTCCVNHFNQDIMCDPNVNYEILDQKIKQAFDKHIPVKLVKFNRHKHKLNNWVTGGILTSIRFRDKLYKRMINSHSDTILQETLKNNLSSYNRILKKLIKEAKISYYDNCFKKFRNDIKKTWSTIKTILNKNQLNCDFPKYFLANGVYISDKKAIANKFNEYFINVGPSLADSINMPDGQSFTDYLRIPTACTFNFEKVSHQVVSEIIDNLKPKSSCGIDGLSNKLIKFIKDSILNVLTLIINQSIENGIFPDKLKIAKVVPLYKKNENYLFENYRPISVLPCLSKVLERIMHTQITDYFIKQNLFYDHQYGFRHSHSTELATLELIDRIINCMDNKEIPLAIFLDLSKAFDTIDHKILLHKLKYYGIIGKSLALVENYLSDRKQSVIINDTKSSLLPIKIGVPQGSILGPLLFIIYINDLHVASDMFHPIIYADDTTLSATLRTFGTPVQDRDSHLNLELMKITNWLILNKLSLNSSKTKAMLFHTPRKSVIHPNIFVNQNQIEFVDTFEYLGIVLDKNVNWKAHLAKISTKLSKVVGIMCKLKNTLPKEILRTLYNSLFLPYVNYGLLCWKSRIKDVIKLQKKVIRIIGGEKYNAHTEPIFKKYNLLKITDLCTLQEYKFCFKLENSLLPTYFQSDLFIRNSSIHNHRTRTAQSFRTPRIRHEFAKNSISFFIPSAFNNCPINIKNKIYSHSFFGFIKYVKRYFINEYSNICHIRNCYICQSH